MKSTVWNLICLTLMVGYVFGCAATPQRAYIKGSDRHIDVDQIISTASGETVSFDDMIADLSDCRIVYVGESHTNPRHHAIQLEILKALFRDHTDLAVGMEMFDVTYQVILDQWSDGQLSRESFIEKTHWYANWRYNFELYQDIISFIKDNHIPLVGLNIPFHIPPKVRIGGIDSLLGDDRRHLPDSIDTTNEEHRAYIEAIFNQHRFHGDANFEFFYQAQCLWEDTMASSVARHLGDRLMVVFVGNGHIINRYGIPERAYRRTKVPYRSVYLAQAGDTVELSMADFIWISPEKSRDRMR